MSGPGPSADRDAAPPIELEPVDHGRLARGFSVQLLGRGVSLVLSVVSLTLTVRYLGIDDYGVLTAVVVFAGVFDAFSDIGLSTVVVRRVSTGKGDLERLVGLNLATSLTYAVPAWAIATTAGFLVYTGRPDYQLGVAIVGSSVLFRAVATCLDPVLQVASRFGPLALSDIVGRVLALLLMVVSIGLGLGLVAFFSVQVVPAVARLLIQGLVVRGMGRYRPVFHLRDILSLLREGVPLAAIALIGVLYYRADGVVLSLTTSESEVGSYGLGYRIATTLAVIPLLFGATVFPTLARTYALSLADFRAFATKAVEAMTFVGITVALFGYVFAPDIVGLLTSPGEAPSATGAARLLFVASALGFLNLLLSQCLIAAHDQRFLVGVSMAVLVANVGLNVGLDGRYGAVGAGTALVITEVISVAVAFARLSHSTGCPVPVSYAARLAAAAAATLGAWSLTSERGPLVLVPLLGLTFLVGLVAAGPLRPAQARALIALVRPRS